MMTHLKGGAAALCLALLTAPAFGQAASPAQAPEPTVLAQAKAAAASDDAAPTRRQRAKAEKSDGKPTAGQTAARERQKACAAEWKTAKAAGKVETGMKWPKYWSQCNTRLKAEKA